jgi:hypothetical protein
MLASADEVRRIEEKDEGSQTPMERRHLKDMENKER